ncbi:MAG: hypothetical protein ACP5E3_10110 [Bacteroidales bacterium]
MIRVSLYKKINQPHEILFGKIINLADYNKWMSRRGFFRKTVKVSPGDPKKGTIFYDYTIFGKFKGEIKECKYPEFISFRQTLKFLGFKLMESRPSWELKETSSGTLIHHFSEFQLYGLSKVLYPIAQKMAIAERTRVLNGLIAS